MEVNRRTFVKGMAFAGGAALGVMLSPAPWYLIRDMAFWTQNWSWVPGPVPGEPSFDKTICRMCDGGCGIRIRKVDDRLVRIDGDCDHPVNRGSICPLGTAALQMLYSPARVKTPLKRSGDRANPKWEPLSWEKALKEVTDKLRALRSAGRSHSVACIASPSDSVANELFERFLQPVGSPNFIRMNSKADAQDIVYELMYGGEGKIAYDIENARCILSFGCDLFAGWGVPGRMYHAQSVWLDQPGNAETEIIQIDPSLSITAAKSSRWVPITPGAEAALALGIAHVLIRDGLYDKAFVKNHCFGFENWTDQSGKKVAGFKSEVLSRYSPQSVELMAKVSAKEIEELAYTFAASKPSLALCGGGGGDLYADMYALMAVHSLNALVGNINQPGGILSRSDTPVKPLPPVSMDEEAVRGYSTPRIDEAGGREYPFTRSLPDNIDAREVEVLFVHEANPYYALSDQKTAEEIFGKIPYIVSLSSYLDESTMRADLILPIPTPFERWDDLVSVPGFQYPVYDLTRPVVKPLYDTKNAGDIVIEIAHRLGGAIEKSFPWNNVIEVVIERAQGLHESNKGLIDTPEALARVSEGELAAAFEGQEYPSFSAFWSDLVQHGCWFDPVYNTGDPTNILKTPSGKFEFFSQRLQSAFGFSEAAACMPHYTEPVPNPEGFDLIIMPVELVMMAGDGLGTPPLLIKQLRDNELAGKEMFVQINPITAMYQGLKDGDAVILESSRGKAKVRIHTFAGVREGVVLIPLGFGHTAYDQFLRNKGVNAHQMLDVGTDRLSGLPARWSTPGKLRRA